MLPNCLYLPRRHWSLQRPCEHRGILTRFQACKNHSLCASLHAQNLIIPALHRCRLARPNTCPCCHEKFSSGCPPEPGQIFVDGTLGGAGHAKLLAERVGPRGLVLGLDRDPAVIERAESTLQELPIRPIHANYSDLAEILDELEIKSVDGILLDLGLSSDQLADAKRGFSFQTEGPLDLRFDPTRGEPACACSNE